MVLPFSTRKQALETCEITTSKEISREDRSDKVMMSFFYHKGPLLIEFLERGITINGQRYQVPLQNLRRAIKSKRPGMLSNGVICLHDKCANSFDDFLS
ncbi:histone-lysine N-methyltransferase SETMAR [Trichonephila clavipes]|nr:histone-lysine N-methyltransferase SETMAR [Trichonephila clavipes]